MFLPLPKCPPPWDLAEFKSTDSRETILLQSLHEHGPVISLFKSQAPQSYNGDNEYLSHRIVDH